MTWVHERNKLNFSMFLLWNESSFIHHFEKQCFRGWINKKDSTVEVMLGHKENSVKSRLVGRPMIQQN